VTYEYKPKAGPNPPEFETVHFETFGKSQVRRVVPGEYLATDPKGRAIIVASTEKNKLIYTLTRSTQGGISISSPLEAHKPQTLMYCLIGLDVAYDNPMFAAIELDFSSAEADPTGEALQDLQKELVYYELDLGLNHIVRKWSEPIDRTANILFRVPGGAIGPSGVLCCGEDNITYRRIFNNRQQLHRVAIPRREGATEDPNRKRFIVAGTHHTMRGRETFWLLQTNDGDLFKLTMDAPDGEVQKLKIQYFDTIPLATSICVIKVGFLFIACESGDRVLYLLDTLGEDSNDAIFDSSQFPTDPLAAYNPPFFRPRPLSILKETMYSLPSLNPIMDMEVANPGLLDAPQIYTVNGESGRSSFRTTKNALSVLELIDSELPSEASSVWTTKLHADDDTDTLIILCMHSKTLVLRISDDVNEAFNTGFLLETNTLGVQQFGEDCIIQIHPSGIRHIQGIQFPEDDSNAATYFNVTDWETPAHRTIVACATNNRQVAIALSSGQILYFECDSDGSLAMAEEEVDLDVTIKCLAIPDVPDGSVRAYFMAVGCSDQTVRIFNLSPDMEGSILRSISVQGLSAKPSDLTINHMKDKSPHKSSQYLHIGLESGVYIRSVLDEMTGEIGDTRRRFLGPGAVTFARVTAGDQDPEDQEPGDQGSAVLAMGSSPWLAYTHPTTRVLQLTPLDYIPFHSAWSFDGSSIRGVICVSGKDLR
jgi:splicing factor 3B subunit 3